MVTYEDIDTKEERKEYTRNNPGSAIITRKDGSTVVKQDGKTTNEYNSKGTGVVRLSRRKNKSGGGSSYEKVDTAEEEAEVAMSDRVRTREKEREQLLRERENAIRDSNFSSADGYYENIAYTLPNQQSRETEQYNPLDVGMLRTAEQSARPRPVREFVRGAKEGFLLSDDTNQGISNPAYDRGRELGNLLLIPATALTPGGVSMASRASAATTTAVIATRVGQAVSSTRIGRFATALPAATAETLAIVEAGRFIGEQRNLNPQQRELLRTDEMQAAITQARIAEAAAVKSGGLDVAGININPRGFAYELVGSIAGGKRGREGFEQGLRAELQDTPLNPYFREQAVEAGLIQKRSLDRSEVAALLNIARFSEGFGRKEVARVFDDLAERGVTFTGRRAAKIATVTAPSIGSAGFIEGFAQEVGQQRVRGQKIDVGKATTMGGVGAVSAATIGGFIAGGSAANLKATPFVEYGSYAADVFEKPGDLFQDLVEGQARRSRAPVIAASPTFVKGQSTFFSEVNPNIGAIETLPRSPTIKSKGKSFGFTTTFGDNSFTFGVPTSTSTNPFASSLSQTPANVPANPLAPTTTTTSAFAQIPNPVNFPTNVLANIPVNPNTQANVFTNTNVPISVPDQGFLPFPPPVNLGNLFPGSRARAGSKKRKGATKSIAQQIFNIPEELLIQQSGKSEQTGIFLRN